METRMIIKCTEVDYLLGITGGNMIEWRDGKVNVALLVYNLIFI